MTTGAKTVLQKALRLDAIERAEIIDALFNSFDKKKDNRVDDLWAEEAESRISAFDKGKIKAEPAEEVFRRIGRK
jgi:putative addiction module component (TIGR02574 family)